MHHLGWAMPAGHAEQARPWLLIAPVLLMVMLCSLPVLLIVMLCSLPLFLGLLVFVTFYDPGIY